METPQHVVKTVLKMATYILHMHVWPIIAVESKPASKETHATEHHLLWLDNGNWDKVNITSKEPSGFL